MTGVSMPALGCKDATLTLTQCGSGALKFAKIDASNAACSQPAVQKLGYTLTSRLWPSAYVSNVNEWNSQACEPVTGHRQQLEKQMKAVNTRCRPRPLWPLSLIAERLATTLYVHWQLRLWVPWRHWTMLCLRTICSTKSQQSTFHWAIKTW